MAKRVSSERDCNLGSEVGYTVRFDDCSSQQKTQIKYVTDGILVRECLMDPDLMQYQVVILDEAHERSLNTDILFALVKQAVLRRRGTLRLIITSATLKTDRIAKYYFGDGKQLNKQAEEGLVCPIISVSGRCFPVAIMHQECEKD